MKSIISTIYQSFGGKDLYPSIEKKAANLFIYFLEFYGILQNGHGPVIDNNTLVAVTLLIAESNPKEKNILIDLVMNFLTN